MPTRRRSTCCRRCGSATPGRGADAATRPRIERDGAGLVVANHALAGYRLEAAPGPDGSAPETLFCENETNTARVFGTEPVTPFPKDGINDHVVSGLPTVNPDGVGTKAAFHYVLTVPAGGTAELRLLLHRREGKSGPKKAAKKWAAEAFDGRWPTREADADEFYAALAPPDDPRADAGAAAGVRGARLEQADVPLRRAPLARRRPGQPAPPSARLQGRNANWRHLDSFDVLAMPDPWEYPWFAAWDLGFHAVPWAHLDPAFAKYQLLVLLREWFMHPNGALPAYEWNFDDVNPPVHVMAALRVFRIDGSRDREFLERVFQKLLVNYTWWVNRQDADGNNVFGGGFLGLDNISPVDRSTLPAGVKLEQADGTAWMAYYTLSMLLIAIALAEENDVYQDMVIKFLEQFVMITRALDRQGLYDAEDAFFYDRITPPGGEPTPGQGEDDRRPDPAPARRRAAPCRRPSGRSSWASGSRVCASGSSRRAGALVGRVREVGEHAHGARLGALARRPAGGRFASSSTRTRSCRPTACARCRSATRTRRTRSRASPARQSTTSRPSRRRRCSAATRTGAARCGCR